MKRSKSFKMGLILMAIPFILGLIFYPFLPDSLPTHYNIEGQADAYSSKAFALFGLPAIMLGAYFITYFFVQKDPKKENQGDKILVPTLLIFPIMTIVISMITIVIGKGGKVNVGMILGSILSVVFIFIGNYLPKVKRNYTIGIKLPWTLDNDEIWDKTHRLAGKVWMIGGFFSLISVFLFPRLPQIYLIAFIVMGLIPSVYSYILYQSMEKREGSHK